MLLGALLAASSLVLALELLWSWREHRTNKPTERELVARVVAMLKLQYFGYVNCTVEVWVKSNCLTVSKLKCSMRSKLYKGCLLYTSDAADDYSV